MGKRSFVGIAEQRNQMDVSVAFESIISCNICFDTYKDPRVLKCQHIFCYECINKLPEIKNYKKPLGNNQKVIPCPNCREEFIVDKYHPADKLPKAFYLNNVIEFYENTYSKSKPSAPPEDESDIPRNKSRRISYQLTHETFQNLSSAISKNDEKNVEKIISDQSTQNRSTISGPTTSNRFGNIAEEIKRNSQSPQTDKEPDNYIILRDQANILQKMDELKEYSSLKDNVGLFKCTSNNIKAKCPNLDMQFINDNSQGNTNQTGSSNNKCSRILISHDGVSDCIWIHADKMSLSNVQQKKTNLEKISLPHSSNIHEIFLQAPTGLPFKIVSINYYRYSNLKEIPVIFFTCDVEASDKQIYGVVLCYQIDMAALYSKNSSKVLTYKCSSKLFETNFENSSKILHGIDIDRKNFEIYVASPRNYAIHRLSGQTLNKVDNEWMFEKSKLKPTFLAYDSESEKIWASCPDQDKLIIMDKRDGKYRESSPKLTIQIELTQIIYTTDKKIIGLDNCTGQAYWLKTANDFLYSQLLEQVSYKKQERIHSIKPVEDVLPTEFENGTSQMILVGGLMCSLSSYGYALFPKSNLFKPRTFTIGNIFMNC